MWVFINEDLIQNTESGLCFEKRTNDDWQVTNQSWHEAVSRLPSQSTMQWIRQTRIAEIECSLWALYRQPKEAIEAFTFPEVYS